MKKTLSRILCILAIFSATPSMAQEYQITTDNLPNGKIVVTFDLLVDPGLTQTYTSDQYFSHFKNLTKFSRSTEKGFPEVLSKQVTLSVDPDADYSVQIIESVPTTFNLPFPYLVGRGTITRNQNPKDVRHVIDQRSRGLKRHPAKQIEKEEKFLIRNVSGFNFRFNVTEFDTEQNTAKVFKHLKFEITPKQNSARASSAGKRDRTVARELHKALPHLFLNYKNSPEASSYISRATASDILVIYTARDESAIQPYIQHKRSKGFTVQTIKVATGTNVKSVIQNAYNQNRNIYYVQLVGDWDDIKSDLGTSQNAPMDPMLGRVSGTDNYPDVAIGRFSANSAAEVTTQVNKTITYEQNFIQPFWKNGIGIGSEEGAGAGDDGEIDYVHIDIIKKNKLLAKQQYTSVGEVYGASGSASQVASLINNGAHVINYCGHGSNTSWGTTGFSSNDVNNLSNGNKLPIIFSVACVNGAYHQGTSFSESWLRKTNGGAVAALMATINQPWTPPMRGQDYFNDLLTGGYSYSAGPGNGTNTTAGKSRLGDIVLTGLSMMYAESSGADDLDTISTWTLFGDSSLLVVGQPSSGGPAGYTRVAGEGGSFALPGMSDVAYGANGKFYYKYGVTGTIAFNNATFGDPIPGTAKSGYYKLAASAMYVIRARHSGKVLDVAGASTSDGGNVHQWTYGGGSNQQWKLLDAGGGNYYISAKHSGKVLDVAGVSSADGANIYQWTNVGGANQQWKLQATGDGYYSISAKHSGKCLDVAGYSTADGANVHQWACHGGTNQHWKLEKIN